MPDGKAMFQVNIFQRNIAVCTQIGFALISNNLVVENQQYYYQNAIEISRSNYSLKVFQETFNSNKLVFTCSNWYFFAVIEVNPLKRQPQKIVDYAQTIRQLLPANCFSVFDHFVGLMLKVLTIKISQRRRRFGVFLLTLN